VNRICAPSLTPEPQQTARAGRAMQAFRLPLWAAIALALAASAAIAAQKALAVIEGNAFFDSDDAMRAVQLRDLLAGQSWFDMTAWRVDPPFGMFNHWSRVIDIPLATLELFFRLFLDADGAERAARLAFPFALLAALYRVAAFLAQRLDAPRARLAAVAAAYLSGPMFLQFAPGRIDHHAPQIILLILATGFFCEGLAPQRARAMVLCAAAMAVSFAISLENVPFFLPLIAALPIFFIIDGAAMRGALLYFALGVLLAFPIATAATIAPARYALSFCDAYSAVHLAAMLLGALGLALLAIAEPYFGARFGARFGDWRARLVATPLAGLPAVAAVFLIAPRCVGDPLVDLDPLLRKLWLVHVAEMQPLLTLAQKAPNVAIGLSLPSLLAVAACLVAARFYEGLPRRRALSLAVVIFAGFLVGVGQVRVLSSVAPLASVPLAIAIVALVERYAVSMAPLARASAIGLALIAASPVGLTLALPSGEAEDESARFACLKPEALTPLATLPRARIAAPIDMGAHILAFSPHSVFAAPYHRDNHGGRLVVDAFSAPPARAESLLRAAGAELVVWCSGWKASGVVGDAPAPNLAAALAAGETPAWLEEKNIGETPLHVFAVRPNPY